MHVNMETRTFYNNKTMRCILIQYNELPRSQNALKVNSITSYGVEKTRVAKTFDLDTQGFNTTSCLEFVIAFSVIHIFIEKYETAVGTRLNRDLKRVLTETCKNWWHINSKKLCDAKFQIRQQICERNGWLPTHMTFEHDEKIKLKFRNSK